MNRLIPFLLLTVVTASAAVKSASASFWTQDVWRMPERPFLYYGEPKEERPARKEPSARASSLDALQTLEELQAERGRRLSLAVMHPTPENIRDYLEMNAWVQEKAARFAAGWREVLLRHPQWDWTASHPVVNAASTALSREDDRRVNETMAGLGSDWGLLFFADRSKLTELMLPLVERFAALFDLELVVVAVGEGPASGADDSLIVRPDEGLHRAAAGGLTAFPALLLVHREDRSPADARLLATGVVDVSELARRTVRLTGRDAPAVPRALPGVWHDSSQGEKQ